MHAVRIQLFFLLRLQVHFSYASYENVELSKI